MTNTIHHLFCLDRYNNKNVSLPTKRPLDDFAAGDRLVYELPGEGNKQSLAIYLGYTVDKPLDRSGNLLDQLRDEDKNYLDDMQKKADEKYKLFKKEFKKEFPTAIPVTARYQIFAEQYYFFFYAEERFNFADFVKRFRGQLGHNFFLFQVGARDMVKMSPATDCLIGCNGINLCCKSNRPLPSIEVEALLEQHLDGRDIERLKGRCGKLKCSLLYEAELYFEENRKYPPKGNIVESDCGDCGTVISFNIMTGKVNVKTEDGNYLSLDLAEVKKHYKPKDDNRPKPVRRRERLADTKKKTTNSK